ncbi:hypothetical protein JKP88DRAFT_247100 [Tribonema minus]|uniref:Uncharacterized protein n=1 Tax=Tribonema minus TaxID=303371 RepID=A0A835YST8_9STRA|nr:hypothetical protein JKP88DRAFT_247100 [Tribonema minus]
MVLSWDIDSISNSYHAHGCVGIAAPLSIPVRHPTVAGYFSSQLPHIIEEARAIVWQGLEKIPGKADADLWTRGRAFARNTRVVRGSLKTFRRTASEPDAISLTVPSLPRSDDDEGFADVALLLFMAHKNNPKAYHLEGVLALASCKQQQGAGPSMTWTIKFTNSRGWDIHGVAAVGLVRLGTLVQARRMFVAASNPLPCVTRVPFLASLATGTAHTLGAVVHTSKVLIQHHLVSLNKLQAKAVCGVVAAAESIKASHRGIPSAAAGAAVTAPVLIQGPPGTGKTTAVVQVIIDVL